MTYGGTPAGWYPDPAQPKSLRWWDGSTWTEHAAPVPAPRLQDEETPARRAKVGVACAAVASFISNIGLHAVFRSIIENIDEFGDASTVDTFPGGGWFALSQVASLVQLVGAAFFLVWFYHSAGNARALGFPARREPGLATASFLIPVVNLWWPYQSTADLMRPDDPNRAHVLPWFLLWIVGGFVSAIVSFASAFVDGPAGWMFLIVPAIQLALAAGFCLRVIDDAVAAHRA